MERTTFTKHGKSIKLDLEYQVPNLYLTWINLLISKTIFLCIGKEHWIGLNAMHKLTNKPGRTMQLRISMEKFSGTKAINFYDAFSIGDEVLDIFII